MARLSAILLTILVLPGCGYFQDVKPKDQDPVADLTAKLVQLQERLASWKAEARGLRDPATGWLLGRSCDGTLWQGKYAAAADTAPSKAPILDAEGRGYRRPLPRCWNPQSGDQGAVSTWSRDMGMGLILWSWRTRDRDAAERHQDYGIGKDWFMGQPVADGRVLYSLDIRSVLHQVVFYLGGKDHGQRQWPGTYPGGLDDFHAHLQVMSIQVRGEVAAAHGDADALPREPPAEMHAVALDINGLMYRRLEEHHQREPENPYFAAVWGHYSGKAETALNLCLDPAEKVGSYVRCEDFRRCQLAELIHACDYVQRVYQNRWTPTY